VNNPTSQALAKREANPTQRLMQQYGTRLAAMVPQHVNGGAWLRQATGTLRDPDLMAAAMNDFGSFVAAVERAAVLGLRPGSEEYYLVPRKVKGQLQVVGIVGWQGYIELMYNSGAVASVVADVVHQADLWVWKPGQLDTQSPPRWQGPMAVPLHEVDWDAEDRGAMRLVYAYARMSDGGTSRVIVLNKAQIAKIRSASDSAGSSYSPWTKWEESMWLKSAVRQLRKWVPTSVERIRQQAQAHAIAAQAAMPAIAAGPVAPSAGMTAFAPSPPAGVNPTTGEVDPNLIDEDDDWADAVQQHEDEGARAEAAAVQ
jgi:recombination protein RecT